MNEYRTQNKNHGQLKIFLGYAAGVGKTYEMLEEAHQLKQRGVDVVVGYVEPQIRPETTKLLNGLERLPQKYVYDDITVNEFNLDAALKRHPSVLIVDELAHTNLNQKYHEKRYQDIETLLEAGINVFTTMNVQHLESLHDIVETFTHVHVRERVPDRFFDQADQIELVDIDPDDLLDRMRLGKIYPHDIAQRALNNFFTIKNLTALRETALRRMTMRVSVQQEAIERLLVCFSGSPTSKTVLRSAAQLAHAFSGELTALYIARNESEPSSDVKANYHLAEELGMRVVTLYGEHRGTLITEYCKSKYITKLILGSGKTSLITKIRYGGSLVDELNKSLPEVDKYIIPHEKYGRRPWIIKKIRLSEVFKDSCVIIAILSLITLLGEIYKLFHISNINTVLLYILGVMVVSLLTHTKWSGFGTAICSVALFNFFFTYPYGSLISASQNWITFVIMGIVGLLSSSWTTRLQLQSAYEAKRAERTEILLNASHAFEKTNTLNDVLVVLGHQANELFKRKIVIYPKQKDNLGIPIVFPYGTSNAASSSVPNNERAIANWVLKHNHPAGKMTDTLPREGSWYLPIQEDNNTPVAVMCIILNKEDQFDSLTRNLIVSILDTSTLAIQRIREAEDKRQVALTMRQEKLRYDLLRGISHDLRTPLTTISGNADMIRSQGDKLSIAQIKELAQSIYNDSNWLTQMVENLLSMTRITNGKFKITRRPELISEIFNEALDHIAPGSETHKIIVKVPNDLLMVNVDAQLIMQVIINIVNNAIQYSPEDSEIDLSVSLKIDKALVTITNNGPQISEEVQKHLFDLFYSQGENSFRRHGMGIGLALCQTIIHASGGDIGVYNRIPRGVSFYFTLPVWEAKK